MKKPLLLLLACCAMSIQAQSLKNENIKVTVPSYAGKPAPESIKTYMGAFAQTEGGVLPFTEEEFQNALNFQGFAKHTDAATAPDLMVLLNGISNEDLSITVARSKANKTYSVNILPKNNTALGLLIMANGESVHYFPLAIKAKADAQGKLIPETFNFSFDEEEKYLIIQGDEHADASPYLVKEYLKKKLQDSYLTNSLVPSIYKGYDLRANNQTENFHYLKDKKVPSLEEETKGNLLELEKVAASMQTLEELRAGKEQYTPFIEFWKDQLSKYDLSNKTGKKAGWGILVNLHKLSLITEDFTGAKEYLDQAIALGHKKWITSGIKKQYEDTWDRYQLNYDAATGNRIYVDAYTVDEKMKTIAKQKAIKDNNISKAEGYVVTKSGEKMEGKISLRFSPQGTSVGNVVELSGDTTAKRVTVTYVNEKGKTKNKIFKCKEVAEIVIDGKRFASVNPKKPFLEQEAVSMSMLNNTMFMQEIYKSDKITLFKDLTTTDAYYFQIVGVKKAEMASAEFFESCEVLAAQITNEEYSTSEEDQIKIAKTFAEGCN